MQILMHVKKFYDWEPLPAHIKPTPKDIARKLVKPSGTGGWLARVEREGETHTTISLPESELQQEILRGAIREKVVRNRKEALAVHLAQVVVGHHAHRSWMQEFEVHDDGPSETDKASFEKELTLHVDAGNIEETDKTEILAAYAAPVENDHHCEHLHKHFAVKSETVQAFREKRSKRSEERKARGEKRQAEAAEPAGNGA